MPPALVSPGQLAVPSFFYSLYVCLLCLQFQCVRQLGLAAEFSPQARLPAERRFSETDFISFAAGQSNGTHWQKFRGMQAGDKHVQPIAS